MWDYVCHFDYVYVVYVGHVLIYMYLDAIDPAQTRKQCVQIPKSDD